jgi:uncharacterized protein (TIGR02271 family)
MFSTNPDTQLLVHFQNGQQVIVPRELLRQHTDGRYHLTVSVEELLANQATLGRTDGPTHASVTRADSGDDANELVIPVIEEQVTVQTRTVEKGRVEIHKTVHEHTKLIDQPLHMEEVEIERLPINRIIDEPVPVRQEGDTTIISLFEEVLVIEKRLVLREEVHIKKMRTVVHDPQEVLLREERVEIVRKPGNDQAERQDEAQER